MPTPSEGNPAWERAALTATYLRLEMTLPAYGTGDQKRKWRKKKPERLL